MADLTRDDIERWEINEEFGARIVTVERALGLDLVKLNVHGGGQGIAMVFEVA